MYTRYNKKYYTRFIKSRTNFLNINLFLDEFKSLANKHRNLMNSYKISFICPKNTFTNY